ncbi:hypothetical protein NE237_030760 [Protea cynaroides]|uniref:Histidine-containing phosphotransfer protein n=1 Tax=Protea cynaroides TaxID=273540 RepID=A0A9Q0JXL5_9MAGN|nr:hypothetical protein NE237_030760 [Protea cynaroides]
MLLLCFSTRRFGDTFDLCEEVVRECQDMNWGTFKILLTDTLTDHLHPVKVRCYEEIISDSAYLARVLTEGEPQKLPMFQAQPLVHCVPSLEKVLKSQIVLLVSTFSSMERNQLSRQVAIVKQSLFDQGYLDEQFVQLEELQDSDNPNFVEEVVTLFFRDSARLIMNIQQALERNPLDFDRLDNYMHQFKGSSSSIGAKKVKDESTQFREYCKTGNVDGCMRSFQQVKKEHAILKKKLESYFQLARQAGSAGTACRPARN